MSVGALTATGFVAATTDDVLSSIEQDELGSLGQATDLSPDEPLGQLNGIFASSGQLLSSLILAVFTAMDPAGAEGVQLDNLCAITGCERLSAQATVVATVCNLNAGTYAAGALTAAISGFPALTFVNQSALSVATTGNVAVTFVCTQTGAIAANAGTLVIAKTTAGWNSVTNSLGTPGRDVETDTQLRLRRASLLVASGGCTIDSIRSSLLNPELVPGVITANVLENNTLAMDGNGLPPKSFLALVWDGPTPLASNTTIAQAIWNSKPSGIQAAGATTATATDSTGKTHSVAFTRVTQARLYVAYVLSVDATYPATGDSQVQAAAAALCAGLLPGSELYALRLRSAALGITGVLDVLSFAVDTVYPPVNTGNLTFSPFVIPTLSSTDVTVSP